MIKPAELYEVRKTAGLTQEEAAAMVYTTSRTWQKWEAGDITGKAEKNNYRARTELFLVKTNNVDYTDLV